MVKFLTSEEMKVVPQDVLERISKACQANGYTLVNAKRYSDHPDDEFLYTVLAKTKKDYQHFSADSYATWSYNDSIQGLNHGHYISDPALAERDYGERVHLAKNNA